MQQCNRQIFARYPEFWIWKKRFILDATMQQAFPHTHSDEDKRALFKLLSATVQQAVFYTYCQKMSPKSAFCLGATVQQADFRTIP